MTKTEITRAECRCEFDIHLDGSVLADTYKAYVTGFRTHLAIDSPAPAEAIARVIRLAKRSCFAEQLVANPVPLESTYEVNGKPLEAIDLSDRTEPQK